MPGSEARQIDQAKAEVASGLRDPSSAQFRDVRSVQQADGTTAFCGSVNGKNAYGGYVGFRDFVLENGQVTIAPDLSGSSSVQAATDAYSFVALSIRVCSLEGVEPSPPA